MRKCNTKEELDIEVMRCSEKIDGIIKAYEDNPGCDVNAKGVNDLMFDVAAIGTVCRKQFGSKAYDYLVDEIYMPLYEKFSHFMNKYFMTKLKDQKEELGTERLHNYFEESLKKMFTFSLGDEEDKGFLNTVCEVNLFVHQQYDRFSKSYQEHREQYDSEPSVYDSIIYDNVDEYYDLLRGFLQYKKDHCIVSDKETAALFGYSMTGFYVRSMVEEIKGYYKQSLRSLDEKKEVTKKK